ncbi:MAG: hypothetical protein AB7O52_19695 [Planctomycetota bacterium]
MNVDSKRPRARLATLFGFLAVLLSGFAVSQVVQVRGWKTPRAAEVRTLADRVAEVEHQIHGIQIALGIPTSPSPEGRGHDHEAVISEPAYATATEASADPDLLERLRAIETTLAELNRTRSQLRDQLAPTGEATKAASDNEPR